MPFSTVYDAVASTLEHVAASTDNPRKLSSDNASADIVPPLYVWDPQSINDAPKRSEMSGSANPRGYGTDAHVWDVICWGATRDDCERMRAALVRAVRENATVHGRNYDLGAAQWGYPRWAENGYALTVPLTVYLPLVAVEIPTGAGTGIPQDDVTDDRIETVTITALDPRDATDAIEGDGELQGGED